MLGGFWTGVKRFILWDYPRATWQYDLMVGLILCFLFLTPREWFRDQPRIPKASKIAMLPAAHGMNLFWVGAELLAATPETARKTRVAELLKTQTGVGTQVVSLDPISDSEGAVEGYIVYTKH
jgi:hypothetical protein